MTEKERKQKISEFVKYWKGKGNEKSHTQTFWNMFLKALFDIERPEVIINYEEAVQDSHVKYLDAWINTTKVLIEQKSINIDLLKPSKQSNGEFLTAYEQALSYDIARSHSKKAKWIITCNFQEFLIYDMEKESKDRIPDRILLEDLPKEYPRLQFIVNEEMRLLEKEYAVSFKAGDVVKKLYNALLKQYNEKDEQELKSLNELCVRIIFCLYAEDSGLFGEKLTFHNYIKNYSSKDLRRALIDLFKILDTKIEDRGKYLDEDLAKFPYVNGGLFSNENIIIPQLTDEIRNILLIDASEKLDWSEISPTIFGAVFESTLNPETRRNNGMHYTSIENIHKVIDPLFLNELKEEFCRIKEIKQINKRNGSLTAFQSKLANFNFLDPACGSGNFLTETYISLRKLENEVIKLKLGDGVMTFLDDCIKVSIGQFYGIEINDFAVTVAKTALWIAETQMMKETEEIVKTSLDFLPLKSYANIVEANALRIDWETVCPKEKLSYIMGNPPFVGARLMETNQKEDLINVFGEKWKNAGNLDYVACWYKKCADFINNTNIRCALVSTNSVSQGESVANLWKPLFGKGVHIDFAHRTFRWNSEASIKARVHCVIIGFSTARNVRPKIIYSFDRPQIAENINAYLLNAENIFIESRSNPLCDTPQIGIGNKPIDGGYYLFTEDEKTEFINKEPQSEKWFRPWIGSHELINRYYRYCLWLGECSPNELRKMPECMKRVQAVRDFRLSSKSAGTVKLADKPTRFHVENMPKTKYIVIPETSSEKRRYVPIDFLTPDILCSNAIRLMPNATLYHFGVLTSNVHMAWVRAVCGRLKSDYRYSKDIVYNNFPWCDPTDEQKAKIEQTAQGILDARSLYSDCSLADLYDELTMPLELRRAHQLNDKAVMEAYGFSIKMTESECVAELMKMYQKLT